MKLLNLIANKYKRQRNTLNDTRMCHLQMQTRGNSVGQKIRLIQQIIAKKKKIGEGKKPPD